MIRQPLVIAGAGTNYASVQIETDILSAVNATVIDARLLSPASVRELAATADAIITDYFPCDSTLISQLKNCRVVASYGVGYDQIDVSSADSAGIIVTNNPDYCVDEMAEHTLALLLAAWRRIPAYDSHVRAGGWDYTAVPAPRKLAGSTLGVIGYGRIGRAVADRARGLGIHVVVHDLFLPAGTPRVDARSLEDTLSASDVVTLHLPLSDATRGLIGAEQLALMPSGAGLVNTARGALIDNASLEAALESGHLGWAALDATDPEPISVTSRLLDFPNVIITPHAGFYSEQSLIAAQTNAANEVLRVLLGRPPLHTVGRARGTLNGAPQ